MQDDAEGFDDKLRPKQVAAVLGISVDTLRRMIARDASFPVFVEITPKIRYLLRRDLDIWLTRRKLDALDRRDARSGA